MVKEKKTAEELVEESIRAIYILHDILKRKDARYYKYYMGLEIRNLIKFTKKWKPSLLTMANNKKQGDL